MQSQEKLSADILKRFRKDVRCEIMKQYPTVEKFCFEHDIEKSILSRLLTGKQKHFRFDTLSRIAGHLGKSVEVRLK